VDRGVRRGIGSGGNMPGRELSACYAGGGVKANIESYHQGLRDCLMMIRRGINKGLSLQDSFDAAEKAIEKTEEESNVNHRT